MATASKAPAASTPKNTMAAAPTPSPRPLGRPFSHKSPAIKTPASLHGHSHNVSTASHPSSTPLAAPTFGDDALAYASPAAALIASIGSHGLTPSAGDGLGISTKEISSKEGSGSRQRNMEEERLRNLQETQRMLKTRLAGRAICREGVQRIAQHSNLTFAWLDDNNLSIAGNCVDLEIVFDEVQRDLVNDVVLKINTSGVEELQKAASAVLRQDLTPSDSDMSAAPWTNLEAFAANLNRLAHLDHLSSGLNCFEAVDGLYHSFQRIWAEEKKRRQNKLFLSRICEGNLGRPAMHKKRKLGLSVDYWVEKRRSKEKELKALRADSMDLDGPDYDSAEDDKSSVTWLARIGCDAGYPPIRVSKDWLAEEILSDNERVYNSDEPPDEIPRPTWLDPDATLVTNPIEKDDTDEMIIEQAGEGVNSLPKPPNICFKVDLEPAVLLTNSATSTMFTTGVTIALDFTKATTYRQALDDLALKQSIPLSQQGIATRSETATKALKRWARELTVYNKDGLAKQARHSYALHSATQVGAYPLRSFSFGHPRQLAEAIPVLRQYALLWSIMRKLVPPLNPSIVNQPAQKAEDDGSPRPRKSRAPQKKSNIDARRARLDTLLGGASLDAEPGIFVDVSLSEMMTNPSKPKLDLIFPLPSSDGHPYRPIKVPDKTTRRTPPAVVSAGSQEHPRFVTVSIEVEINGKIVVTSASGLPVMDPETLQKMAEIVTISEDLGVLVQWILSRLV